MTKALTISKVNLYFFGFYLALGCAFTLSIHAIYEHSHLEVEGKQGAYTQSMGIISSGNAMASVPSIGAQQVERVTYYEFLFATCVIAFALTYIGTPLYQYFTSVKPLVRAIQSLSKGERADLSSLKSNLNTRKNLQSVVSRQRNATEALLAMLDNNFDVPVNADSKDALGNALLSVQTKFRGVITKEKLNAAVHENLNEIDRMLKDDCEHARLNEKLIRQVSKSVDAGVGVLYKWSDVTDDQHFFEVASYGFYDDRQKKKRVNIGEGQLGEIGVHKQAVFLKDLPKGYLVIQSGLGSSTATDVAIFPLLFKGELYGALEIALFRPLTDMQISLLERASESIGAHFFNYKVNAATKEKLEALTQKQAEELVEIHRLQEATLGKLEGKLKEVEDEKVKNESILEGCVDGVITFDEQGVVTFCNNAATQIFGYGKQHIYKTTIQELLPVQIKQDSGVWKSFYNGSTGEKEISVRTEATISIADGDSVDALLTCTTVSHKGGTLFTFFVQKISVDLF